VKRFLPWLLLLAVAAMIGWLEFHATDDVQLVAGALLAAGFGFAFWRPRQAWLVVLLLWLAIPLTDTYADVVNHHPGLAKPHPLYQTLVALIPVAIGALAGAGARWVASRPAA
jgi:hypothetical protein